MGNAARRDIDVSHMKQLAIGRPPPPLRTDVGSTIHAVASVGAINFGQAARQENSS